MQPNLLPASATSPSCSSLCPPVYLKKNQNMRSDLDFFQITVLHRASKCQGRSPFNSGLLLLTGSMSQKPWPPTIILHPHTLLSSEGVRAIWSLRPFHHRSQPHSLSTLSKPASVLLWVTSIATSSDLEAFGTATRYVSASRQDHSNTFCTKELPSLEVSICQLSMEASTMVLMTQLPWMTSDMGNVNPV